MIEIICATRYSEAQFWQETALGISLYRLRNDPVYPFIALENRQPLPEIYNLRIQAADSADTLVFIHDDVWIDDHFFAQRIEEGLSQFDIIGIVGNTHCEAGQPAWRFCAFEDNNLIPDDLSHLSGRIGQGPKHCGPVSDYGVTPQPIELLDGVFIAARKDALLKKKVLFDPQFDFHFYDTDFCRTARAQGLRIGTWPIALTHQSDGAYGSGNWHELHTLYQAKWNPQPR